MKNNYILEGKKMKGLKISKNIKIKLFVLVTFLVLMFVQIGPYLLYADENELVFSYKRINLVATNEYYNSNNLFFSEAYVGQNVAYCLDYGVPLPVSSGGTVKYVRTLSSVTTAALVYGYPNVSAASLGVNSDEEARLATQFAVWSLVHSTDPNDTRKSDKIFDMDNLVATTGYEAYMDRVKSAARRIIARSLADPYVANPTLNIVNNAELKISGDKLIAGPYKINGNGFDISSVSVSLTNAPSSAYLCDVNGNAKSSFGNGDDIYIALSINDQNTTIGLSVEASGNHNIGKVYGTGVENDSKQDYAFLTTVPDKLTALANINIPKITGGIKVLKTDQYSTPLEGVTFELRDTSGNVLQTKKTNASGIIEFSDLSLGKYVVAETSTLDGYVMLNVPTEVEVTYNHVTELTIENRKIEGGLKIIKLDEDREKPLAGVKFEILDSNKKVIDTIVTNNEGIAVTSKLAVGTYYFREVSAPSNIVVDKTEYEFKITKPNVTLVKELNNYYTRGKLTIQKTTTGDNKPLEGVKFKIYDSNKNYVETIVTDANGKATTSLLKHGTYYYEEVEAPSNVIKDTNMHEFTMEYTDKTINVTNDYAKGKLKIVKTGDDEKPLKDVVFEILDSNKNVVDTITTDADGIAISQELKLGTYYYKEVKAPDNVIKDENEYEFKLTENNQVLKREIENELLKMGKLKIVKTTDDKKPLKDVVFEILDSNKNVVDTITTDENGVATSKELELGKYYYKEVKAPNTVIKDEKEYEFKLTTNGQVVTKDVENTLKRGSLSIFKVDEDGNYLKGVTFTLLDEKEM
jgi:TQXA domain-containing protein